MKKIYYTHAGTFHCDEITGFAICALAGICEDFKRLTDLKNIPTDGIIADIGREYKPSEFKFDHHQEMLYRDNGYPLATAGLIWKHYGHIAITRMLKHRQLEPDFLKYIWEAVDKNFIQGIDAHDSDAVWDVVATCSAGEVHVNTISSIIANMNTIHQIGKSDVDVFVSATKIIMDLIVIEIIKSGKAYEDREKLLSEIKLDLNDKLAFIPKNVSWHETIINDFPDVDFVICESNHPGNPFSLLAVPAKLGKRGNKVDIERPEWFSGFIHNGKFIAGSDSKEELVKLADYNIKP